VRETVSQSLDSAMGTARQAIGTAKEEAAELAGQAQGMAHKTQHGVQRFMREQPILVAVLGAALGAALGTLLPLSKAEKDLVGATGAKAVGAGRQALATAVEVVHEDAANAA